MGFRASCGKFFTSPRTVSSTSMSSPSRVLVVDADPETVRVTTDAFRESETRFLPVESVEAARIELMQHPFNAVLCELGDDAFDVTGSRVLGGEGDVGGDRPQRDQRLLPRRRRERARQGAYNAWATEYRRLLRVFPILDDDRFDGEVKTGGIAFRHGFPCDARGRPL